MKKSALALAINLMVFGTAYAQNSFSIDASATPNTVPHSMPLGVFDLTQSGSLGITAANSVSCNLAGEHANNSYLRRFDLNGSFAATGNVTVNAVDIGIEQATGTGGTQPVSLRLYAIPNASALTFANLGVAIATVPLAVTDQAATLLNVPVAAVLDGLTNDLVVEVFTPDGQTAGHTFFIGSNATASINPAGAPSFIAAADCGIAEPTSTTTIGFPNMNIVLVVHATSLPVTLQEFNVD